MSSFLISCGGTGGHLSPGISLAEGLVAQGHTVRLLISEKKVDGRLIEKYPHFEFIRIPGTGFSLHPVKFCRCCASQLKGFLFSLRLVKEKRPDGIVGFGGFTSTGVVLVPFAILGVLVFKRLTTIGFRRVVLVGLTASGLVLIWGAVTAWV